MKMLTLTQPWATLVGSGAKRVETRSWGTPYRGPIAIHAAQGLSKDVYPRGKPDLVALCNTEPFASALIDAGFWFAVRDDDQAVAALSLPRGVIVAVATLDRCTRMTERGVASIARLHPREHAFGHYEPGRWAWVLRDIQPLARPVEARGGLGLQDVPVDALVEITDQLPTTPMEAA
jgi:hypothetical protein